MSIFTVPKTYGVASDADLDNNDEVDLNTGNNGDCCGDHFEQYEQNIAAISLLQSINNALEMLQGQSSKEILRTIASGLLCFPPLRLPMSSME